MTFSYFDNSTFLKRIFRFVSSTCAIINVKFTVKPTFIGTLFRDLPEGATYFSRCIFVENEMQWFAEMKFAMMRLLVLAKISCRE